jgi:hypothetical protein
MNVSDKDNYCHNIYQKHILKTSEFLETCDEAAKVLRAYIPFACYTNFRDALFHFRRMVRAYEVNEITCQSFAVKEHTNRAKTDAVVSLLRKCSDIALYILDNCNEYELSPDILIQLRNKFHIMRECISNYRLSGMMFTESKSLKISNEKWIDLIFEYFNFMNDNVKHEFIDAIYKIRHSSTS